MKTNGILFNFHQQMMPVFNSKLKLNIFFFFLTVAELASKQIRVNSVK